MANENGTSRGAVFFFRDGLTVIIGCAAIVTTGCPWSFHPGFKDDCSKIC
jgi:hypothetical protein